MRSRELTEFAGKYMAGGVSSSIRVNRAIGRPCLWPKAMRPKVWDVDGSRRYDLNNSHGATILGHNHPKLRAAVEKALDIGGYLFVRNRVSKPAGPENLQHGPGVGKGPLHLLGH